MQAVWFAVVLVCRPAVSALPPRTQRAFVVLCVPAKFEVKVAFGDVPSMVSTILPGELRFVFTVN